MNNNKCTQLISILVVIVNEEYNLFPLSFPLSSLLYIDKMKKKLAKMYQI